MSHSVKLSINICLADEQKILEDMKQRLVAFVNKNNATTTFENQINQLNEAISQQIDVIKSMEGIRTVDSRTEDALRDEQEIRFNVSKEVDSILKRISFLESSLNFNDELSTQLENADNLVKKIIVDNGYMASLALENLSSKSINLNADNLIKEINAIRVLKYADEKLLKAKNDIKKYIETLAVPSEIKVYFMSVLSRYSTPQEINDSLAMFKHLENEYAKTMIKLRNFVAAAKHVNFTTTDSITSIESDKILLKLKLENKTKNSVAVLAELNGDIRYKMGNYEGHMCEKDSKILLEKFAKTVVVNSKIIIRDISDSRPLEHTTKEWGK